MLSHVTLNLGHNSLQPSAVNLKRYHILPKFSHQWIKNEQIASLLLSYDEDWISENVQHCAVSGSIFMYNRKLNSYKRDSYWWRKRKCYKNCREDHMTLKVKGVKCIGAVYVHSALISSFHRRTYWLLQNPDIILVHYLNFFDKESQCQTNVNLTNLQITSDLNGFNIDLNDCTSAQLYLQLLPMFYTLHLLSQEKTTTENQIIQIIGSITQSALSKNSGKLIHNLLITLNLQQSDVFINNESTERWFRDSVVKIENNNFVNDDQPVNQTKLLSVNQPDLSSPNNQKMIVSVQNGKVLLSPFITQPFKLSTESLPQSKIISNIKSIPSTSHSYNKPSVFASTSTLSTNTDNQTNTTNTSCSLHQLTSLCNHQTNTITTANKSQTSPYHLIDSSFKPIRVIDGSITPLKLVSIPNTASPVHQSNTSPKSTKPIHVFSVPCQDKKVNKNNMKPSKIKNTSHFINNSSAGKISDLQRSSVTDIANSTPSIMRTQIQPSTVPIVSTSTINPQSTPAINPQTTPTINPQSTPAINHPSTPQSIDNNLTTPCKESCPILPYFTTKPQEETFNFSPPSIIYNDPSKMRCSPVNELDFLDHYLPDFSKNITDDDPLSHMFTDSVDINNSESTDNQNDNLIPIIDFSPEWAYSEDEIKILLIGAWKHDADYSVLFNGNSCKASLVCENVLKCFSPKQPPGFTCLSVSQKVEGKETIVSNVVLFEFRSNLSSREITQSPSSQQSIPCSQTISDPINIPPITNPSELNQISPTHANAILPSSLHTSSDPSVTSIPSSTIESNVSLTPPLTLQNSLFPATTYANCENISQPNIPFLNTQTSTSNKLRTSLNTSTTSSSYQLMSPFHISSPMSASTPMTSPSSSPQFQSKDEIKVSLINSIMKFKTYMKCTLHNQLDEDMSKDLLLNCKDYIEIMLVEKCFYLKSCTWIPNREFEDQDVNILSLICELGYLQLFNMILTWISTNGNAILTKAMKPLKIGHQSCSDIALSMGYKNLHELVKTYENQYEENDKADRNSLAEDRLEYSLNQDKNKKDAMIYKDPMLSSAFFVESSRDSICMETDEPNEEIDTHSKPLVISVMQDLAKEIISAMPERNRALQTNDHRGEVSETDSGVSTPYHSLSFDEYSCDYLSSDHAMSSHLTSNPSLVSPLTCDQHYQRRENDLQSQSDLDSSLDSSIKLAPTAAEFTEYFNAPSLYLERDFSLLTLTDQEQRSLYAAALIIQTCYRSYRDRRPPLSPPELTITEKETKAATVIQASYRRYQQYIYFKKMSQAAVVIQSQFRSFKIRRQFKICIGAATIIQKSYRERLKRKSKAVILIQQTFRSHQSNRLKQIEPKIRKRLLSHDKTMKF